MVVVAIIAIVTAMLLPALTRARRQAQIVNCASNMRQAFTSLTMYANDFHDNVWNYGPGPHDHRDPEDAAGTPNAWAKWYEYLSTPGTVNFQHMWDEGLCKRSYWRGLLIERHYSSAQALGCSIPRPDGFDCTVGGNTVEPDGSASLNNAPPFIYYGRAVANYANITVYTGGNIADWSWNVSDAPRQHRSAHEPKPSQTRLSVMLTCPAYTKPTSDYLDNYQIMPHQAKPIPKMWSEWGGFGVAGMITAENVCWNDGSVQFMDSQGKKFKYIHPETKQFVDSLIVP
jgi:type II secretory pathway pseudopilin PulG